MQGTIIEIDAEFFDNILVYWVYHSSLDENVGVRSKSSTLSQKYFFIFENLNLVAIFLFMRIYFFILVSE